MDAAEANMARRACLAVMVPAAGVEGCAMVVGIEIRMRDVTVAIVAEMRFTGASFFAESLEQGMLALLDRCGLGLFGLELPQIDLVARGLCIRRVGQ